MKALKKLRRKSSLLTLVKQRQNFAWVWDGDTSYLFVNGQEIFKFKANNKNVNFPTRLNLGSISDGFSDTESREVSIYKSYILKIRCTIV